MQMICSEMGRLGLPDRMYEVKRKRGTQAAL